MSSSDIEVGSNPPPVPDDHHPRGYPALANFIGSDKDFFIFRRFNTLSARSLLYLQDELIELEDKLLEIDLRESRSGGQVELWNCHSRREDSNQQRKTLMVEAREKLREYRKHDHGEFVRELGTDWVERAHCIPRRSRWHLKLRRRSTSRVSRTGSTGLNLQSRWSPTFWTSGMTLSA